MFRPLISSPAGRTTIASSRSGWSPSCLRATCSNGSQLQAQEHSFFLLHSASSGAQARYSYLALDAPRYHVEADGDTRREAPHPGRRQAGSPEDRQPV